MVLPSTYTAALLFAIVSMLCWGSWANTLKASGKWRFELYYFDYSFGVLILAIVAGLTLGSWGDLNLMDYIDLASKRQLLFAVLAGIIFNLANMLLVGAISVAGLAVAFPVGIGLTMVIGVVWNYLLVRQGDPLMLFGGTALIILAIIVDAFAYRRHEADASVGRKRKKGSVKGILLSLVAGILMGTFYPLVVKSMSGPAGVQPYLAGLMFAIGLFFSTLGFNMIFMNMPVEGRPLGLSDYFRGARRQHLLGMLGGAIWCIGTVSNFVIASPASDARLGPAVSYALGQGATMISALWGLFLWKEFAGATSKVKTLLVLMIVLFLAGLTLVSIAPLLK